MKPLVLSMDVYLSTSMFQKDGWRLMKNAEAYCDHMWIEGYEVPLERACTWSGGVLRPPQDSFYKGSGYYHVEYQLKDGVSFIPEKAFFGAKFESMSIPEGIATIKNECFRACQFNCDLLFPESLTRICKDAFFDAKISGAFRLPLSIKFVYSMPDSELIKDEIIIPEGVIHFCPEHVCTRHLHLPSTLREFRARYQHPVEDVINEITIDPRNEVLTIEDGQISKKYN